MGPFIKYVCSEGIGEKVDEGVGGVYERCMYAFQKIIECYFNFFKTINFQIPNFVMVSSFKKILRLNSKISVFEPKTGPNLPNWPKWEFCGKFHSCHFGLLIIHYYGAKFQKNP